ncbi:transposase [Streptomyces sp. NPDC018352]|uniref:transposase n=1 Tax=Streptomyces sp. NPDC018352 TaxID=3157194 RepID=UPI0033FCDF4B
MLSFRGGWFLTGCRNWPPHCCRRSSPVRRAAGRLRVTNGAVFTAVVYVLTSGCAWRHLPETFSVSPATAHRRFTVWTKTGQWHQLHRAVLDELGARGQRPRVLPVPTPPPCQVLPRSDIARAGSYTADTADAWVSGRGLGRRGGRGSGQGVLISPPPRRVNVRTVPSSAPARLTGPGSQPTLPDASASGIRWCRCRASRTGPRPRRGWR